MFKSKLLWREAVIILIVVFSIAGIIACGGGADITGSSGSFSTSGGEDTGTGGGETTPTPTPNQDDNYTLPNDNPSDYYKVHVPFGVGGDGFTNVSYKDTNKLKKLWFDQINRKAKNDGKVFAIRNRRNNRGANNFQNRHTDGQYSAQDYYYFNENGDIVWKEDNTIIKKFVGAVITEYRDVTITRGHRANFGFNDNRQAIDKILWNKKGVYTIGAIYANTLTTDEARRKYVSEQNRFRDGIFDFVTYRHHLEAYHDGWTCWNEYFERQFVTPGFIEVLVMDESNNLGYSGSAGVHSYYAYYGIFDRRDGINSQNIIYMTNQNIYLGQRPEYTDRQLTHTALFTDGWRGWCFLFMPGHKN